MGWIGLPTFPWWSHSPYSIERWFRSHNRSRRLCLLLSATATQISNFPSGQILSLVVFSTARVNPIITTSTSRRRWKPNFEYIYVSQRFRYLWCDKSLSFPLVGEIEPDMYCWVDRTVALHSCALAVFFSASITCGLLVGAIRLLTFCFRIWGFPSNERSSGSATSVVPFAFGTNGPRTHPHTITFITLHAWAVYISCQSITTPL